MDRHSTDLANPQGAPASTGGKARPSAPKRSFASWLLGYDIFLSFALGPPPRGTHSYASDLARRLRERDFSVFFSEDEAPPGAQLDSTLRTGLLRSKILVVIVNRGTLKEPRWVRTEVEEFRKHHPDRPVIPINVGRALQDPTLAQSAQKWLGYEGKIWLDESEEAVAAGIASEEVAERLAIAPTRAKSNVKWRWVVRGVVTVLAALAIGLGVTAKLANDSADRARAELRRAVSMRLVVEAQGMISGARSGGDERALLQLLAAQRIAPGAEAEGGLLGALIRRWDLHKLIVLGVPVMAVAISPDGRQIVSGSDEGLRLWDARTGQPITATLDARTSKVHRIALSPDGNLPGVTDVPRRLWSVKSGRYVMSVAFSPDGRRVVSGDWYGTLRQWDARTGESIGAPLEGHKGEVLSVAYSPDGSRIVSSSSGDCTVRIWASKTGLQVGAAIQGHRMPVTSVAFSPDGERIVSGGYEQTLRRWDVKTGRPIGAPLGEYAAVRSVAFSPDGSRIVSGLSNYTLRLRDARTGQPIGAPFEGHKGDVLSVAFSPDGSRIVSGSGDGTLRLWDARTGQPIGAPFGESIWAVSSVAFSPDGSRIVSGSRDDTVRVWDAEAAQRVGAPLEGHKGMVESVAFSPDSGRIVSGSGDGTLRLWDAKTGQPIGAPLERAQG